MPKQAKEWHCAYCGTSLGFYADGDRNDTCGARECERWARDEAVAEREQAHDDLDRERGWSGW